MENVLESPIAQRLRLPDAYPIWLSIGLQRIQSKLHYVKAVYVLEVDRETSGETLHWLIALSVPDDHAESAAQAVTTVLQHDCEAHHAIVDLTIVEPGPPPAWIVQAGAQPFQPPGEA